MTNTKNELNQVKLARVLPQLGMRYLVKERKGEKLTSTYFRGKNYINIIWDTKDIDCHVERFLPLW